MNSQFKQFNEQKRLKYKIAYNQAQTVLGTTLLSNQQPVGKIYIKFLYNEAMTFPKTFPQFCQQSGKKLSSHISAPIGDQSLLSHFFTFQKPYPDSSCLFYFGCPTSTSLPAHNIPNPLGKSECYSCFTILPERCSHIPFSTLHTLQSLGAEEEHLGCSSLAHTTWPHCIQSIFVASPPLPPSPKLSNF